MNWKEFIEKAQKSLVFSDGSMGVFLQKYGLGGGDCPELWNITRGDVVSSVHKSYIEAGSDLIITNTLGGNRIKLSEYKLENRIKEINETAVRLAKKEAGNKALVAGDVGPTGKFVKPLGPLTFDEMKDIYKEQIEALANAGADCIFFETHIDILELKAGIIACREICGLPVIASVTFEKDGRTVTGSTPEAAFTLLEALGVDMAGTNCGTGPADMVNIIRSIEGLVSIPVIAQANAGLPRLKGNTTVFNGTPETYMEDALKMIEHGVNAVGGCCGTTPEYIRLLHDKSMELKPYIKRKKYPIDFLKLSSRYQIQKIGFDLPFAVIGERLNPTARKKLSEDILKDHYTLFREEALAEEKAGAHILDMNMGIAGQDEARLFEKGIEILSNLVKLPLAIDTANSKAAVLAMKLYPGKPLLNSVSAEKERLKLLKEVKKYGAAFIALPIDEKGIPQTAKERIILMKKIMDEAAALGIDKKNILADPLVLTVSAEQKGAEETLKTIRMYKEELGLFTTMGLSNVSFGLPARGYINRNFLSMATACGLTSAIVNPFDEELMGLVNASDVILSKDINAKNYINKYSGQITSGPKVKIGVITPDDKIEKNKNSEKIIDLSKEKQMHPGQDISTHTTAGFITIEERLRQAVLNGNKESMAELVNEALSQKTDPSKLLNDYLIPAITEVGSLYEKRVYFLPQLMLSAEAMKTAFTLIEPHLKKGSAHIKGKAVFATVRGDVHDIGKNIVILIFKNYGFDVIDLGKDVPNEIILEKAVRASADIIGLSALMTTTMPKMKEFMELLKKKGHKIKVMIGGAAVTREFAESIGAYYSSDAVGAVRKAMDLMGMKAGG